MKVFIYAVFSLAIIVVAVLVTFSAASRKQPELGLHNGQLRACPQTPNCACSEQQDESAYIAPLNYSTTAEQAWASAPSWIMSRNTLHMLQRQRFNNICSLTQSIPCYLLYISLAGTFWYEIEKTKIFS